MADMINLAPSVVAGGAAFIVLLLLVGLMSLRHSLTKQANQFRQQVRHLEKELQKSNKQVLEVRSVVLGLGQKVDEQQEIILHLSERLKELENADTDGRLYSRASKMVKLGADINELIEECELPKAEAELMLSLQKKLSGKEPIPPLSSHPEGKTPVNKPPIRKPAR